MKTSVRLTLKRMKFKMNKTIKSMLLRLIMGLRKMIQILMMTMIKKVTSNKNNKDIYRTKTFKRKRK